MNWLVSPAKAQAQTGMQKNFAHLETIHLARIAAPPPKHFCPTRGEQENRCKRQAFVVL
jgi:endonuclease YncB( thermonuclease family)